MILWLTKIIVAAVVVAATSWLAGARPQLAGFIVALPLVSLLALAFSYAEHQDGAVSISFAKSILVGVPISYLFFLPFLLAERFHWSFWLSYGLGLGLLVVGFFIHRVIVAHL